MVVIISLIENVLIEELEDYFSGILDKFTLMDLV